MWVHIFSVFACNVILCLADDYEVTTRKFPDDFKFGLATSAFQIEGAWNEDGKGESAWDYECHTYPEKFPDRANADVTADSYHKYKEDVREMKWMGAQVYRFSIAWARILPTGSPDNVNKLGVQYYKNLIAELKEANIEPFPTMYHGQLPQVLQDYGGWVNESIIDLFTDYARILFKEFGDDVKHWTTVNEPQHVCEGYGGTGSPPHINSPGVLDYVCAHNIIKAHAKIYRTYEKEFKDTQKGKISMVIDTNWCEPATNSTKDQEASERKLQFVYGWFANPIVFGNYPQVMIDRVKERSLKEGYNKSRLPEFATEEQEYIKNTVDFLAVNTYTSSLVKYIDDAEIGSPSRDSDQSVSAYQSDDWETTYSSWLRVVPWGIRKLLNWISNTYNQPEIIVTENGYVDGNGTLNDTDTRGRYIKLYLSNVQDAIYKDGVNVTGYMVWSLMDNFEWYNAYTNKFGLFYVDFDDPNRTRTMKQSALYYQHVCTTKCLVDECTD